MALAIVVRLGRSIIAIVRLGGSFLQVFWPGWSFRLGWLRFIAIIFCLACDSFVAIVCLLGRSSVPGRSIVATILLVLRRSCCFLAIVVVIGGLVVRFGSRSLVALATVAGVIILALASAVACIVVRISD